MNNRLIFKKLPKIIKTLHYHYNPKKHTKNALNKNKILNFTKSQPITATTMVNYFPGLQDEANVT